ncbi:MAG TPA: efflux transporter outer membrane subunit [Phenylobacterium sp.]|jgi:multidrug efflux system outer membrane protein|uniref:efflux transporter outer membrane subunit n=1 Tax=Phenylobacterium sp. TaxID=1871053 RepID=UPI002D31C5E0|nr:efflux transporter outer membrane subunit [Phenylobacterium sp.]HZZ68119.1 efflux transporter outer membrane subunit [Phenylobacterium sp.]
MKKLLALLLSGSMLAACTLEPHYQRPTPAVPQTWPVGAAYPTTSAAALPSMSYRDVFKDPHLQAIIVQAIANNLDLQIAMANVTIARSQYRVQRAQLLPKIDATGTGTETHGKVQVIQPNGQVSAPRETTRDYNVDLGFSGFELDLFGRLRSLTHAAQQQYLATEAGVHAARLTLVAEVAEAYLTFATDRSLLAIANDTVASAQRSVDLTQARLTGGIAPRTDLRQAQTVLETAKSDVANLTTQVAQDRNALELLVGARVADADLPASIESVDGLLTEVPAGLDSRILLRRPDVVEAEYRLRAANAQIGAARANFFPTISLTALAGATSPALSQLFNGQNFNWTASGSAAQTIFAGGANVANLALSKGQRDLALAQYQQAIQTAFREVADALARRGTINDQMAAQDALVAAATDEYTLETARYQQGIDPFLNALESQRTLYASRQTQAQTRLIKAENLVTLYQTLGGDQLIDTKPAPKLTLPG